MKVSDKKNLLVLGKNLILLDFNEHFKELSKSFAKWDEMPINFDFQSINSKENGSFSRILLQTAFIKLRPIKISMELEAFEECAQVT